MFSTKLRSKSYAEKLPPYCIFIDTETSSIEIDGISELSLELFCYEVWATDNGLPISHLETGTCFTESDFYILLKRFLDCRVIAHNWRFDAAVLRIGSRMNMVEHEFDINVDNSIIPVNVKGFSPFLISLKFDVGNATLICNTNFYKTSLAEIGRSYSYEKFTMPTQQSYPTYQSWLYDLETYCKRDVEILRKSWFFLFQFCNELAGQTPGISIAMASNRIYRKKYMPADLNIQGTLGIPYVNNAEMEAYNGGRTDSFYKGTVEGNMVYKYDVNSLYPSTMIGDIPIRYVQRVETEMLEETLQGSDSRFLFLSDVTLNVDTSHKYSFLGGEGVITKNGFIFPTGRYRLWIWQPMLQNMFNNEWVETIHNCFIYEKYPIFNTFVNELFELRRDYLISGDIARNQLVKIILNSLYGKFGQRKYASWEDITEEDEGRIMRHFDEPRGIERYSDIWEDKEREYLQVGDKIYLGGERQNLPSAQAVTSIAGYITNKARSILYQAMCSILDAGGEVYYCDTDSILSSIELPPEMVSPNEIGKWKLEGTYPAEDITLIAPKHYRVETQWKIKGIRNPSDLPSFTQAQFPNFTTDLASKNKNRRERLERKAFIASITKTPTGENRKRVSPHLHGFNFPIHLTEGQDYGRV